MRTIFSIGLLFTITSAFAQDISERIKTSMERHAAKTDSLVAAGKPIFTPYAAPGYTPEGGLLIAGGGLLSFTTDATDSSLQRSTIPLNLTYTTRSNRAISTGIRTFWNHDKLRINFEGKIANITDDYYGVGYEVNDATIRSDSTTEYNKRELMLSPTVQLRVLPAVYAGLGYRYNGVTINEPSSVMANDPNFQEYGPSIIESGIHTELAYDSRDMVINAYSGTYLSVAFDLFAKDLGGEVDYRAYEVDFRKYIEMNQPGSVVAFKVNVRSAQGNVPFTGMTMVGGVDALRGYIRGQYRDKAGVYYIGEFRNMFLDSKGEPGHHGMVAWIGSGSVGESLSDLESWLPNFGIGYRFEIQPRINLRIDFGIGRNTSGVYFNFAEAF